MSSSGLPSPGYQRAAGTDAALPTATASALSPSAQPPPRAETSSRRPNWSALGTLSELGSSRIKTDSTVDRYLTKHGALAPEEPLPIIDSCAGPPAAVGSLPLSDVDTLGAHLSQLRAILLAREVTLGRAFWNRKGFFILGGTLVAVALGLVQIMWWEFEFQQAARAEARRVGTPYAEGLRVQLIKSVAAAYTVASLFSASDGLAREAWEQFDSLAGTLRSTYGGISNLQLAPCAVVTKISPLAGNEGAIGYRLLEDPDPKKVKAAIDTIVARRLTFVGPLSLIQGGTAIIGRYPVFTSQPNNCTYQTPGVPTNFWGYASMLTSIDDLLSGMSLGQLSKDGFDYAITAPGWGSLVGTPHPSAETIPIDFADGTDFVFASWSLHIMPRAGWPPTSPTLPWKLISLVLACLSGIFTSYALLYRSIVLGRALAFIDALMEAAAQGATKRSSSKRASST